MEILFIGDPHFKIDNLQEMELFSEKLLELATKMKPDFILLAGDVLHTHERIHTTPLNKACEFIDSLRKISPVFVLVGNHDFINNHVFLTQDHWMNPLKEWENVEIVDCVKTKSIKGRFFVFCPYVPPGNFIRALDTIGKKWKKADCIFAHQEFRGCKMGAIISDQGDEWPLEYPKVVSGHIHSRQMPQPNIYYPGSSVQIAFGESEQNIIAQLSWGKDSKEYDLIEHDLKLGRKKIIYADISEVETLSSLNDEETKKNKIKLSLTGNYEEFQSFKKTKKYKDITEKGVKIVFKPKKIKSAGGDEKGGGDEKDDEIEKDEKNEKEEITENSFKEILYKKVSSFSNPVLYEMYELVINCKIVDSEEIIFV